MPSHQIRTNAEQRGRSSPCRARLAACVLAGLVAGVPLAAQSPASSAAVTSGVAVEGTSPIATLPEHTPLNPAVAERSGLYVQPLLPPVGGWPVSTMVDYGSTVERNLNFPDSYLFDAELFRLRLQLRHDFSRRWFGMAELGVASAQGGVADRFFEHYHELIHFTMEERDTRPRNSYGDRLFVQRHGIARVREAHGPRPTDARLSVGLRAGGRSHSRSQGVLSQTVISLTLPTAPSSSIYSRGTPTFSLLQTLHVEPMGRLALEAMGGLGYAPTHGALTPVQRTTFALGSGAARLRMWGRNALFVTIYGQTPLYRDTGFAELDRADIGVDFGYLWQSAAGRQWRVGLTEDMRRQDPGIDLVLKIGTTR